MCYAMHHTMHHVLHRTVHRAMRLRCETQPAERQAVTAFPEIRAFERDAADEFVILACDGIWDVMSSQEAPPSPRSSPAPRPPSSHTAHTFPLPRLLHPLLRPRRPTAGS